jgi:hypothetical protein
MRVGIPTEIKNNEYRVAITPAGVAELTRRGHEVLIQAGAGDGSATWSILRQSCKPRSPVGLVKQPETKRKCGRQSRTRRLV